MLAIYMLLDCLIVLRVFTNNLIGLLVSITENSDLRAITHAHIISILDYPLCRYFCYRLFRFLCSMMLRLSYISRLKADKSLR